MTRIEIQEHEILKGQNRLMDFKNIFLPYYSTR